MWARLSSCFSMLDMAERLVIGLAVFVVCVVGVLIYLGSTNATNSGGTK